MEPEEPSPGSVRRLLNRMYGYREIKLVIKILKLYWKYIFTVMWPVFMLPVFAIFGTDVKIRCLYVEVIMYGYWVTACIPEAVTALIPMFMLPLLRIQYSWLTCKMYFKYGFLALSALFLSAVIDNSKIHERVSLYLIWKLGSSSRVIHTVFTTITALISIRVANAYVAQMMVPMITKILKEIDTKLIHSTSLRVAMSKIKFNDEENDERPLHLSVALYNGVIFGTIFGGINFTGGSGTNFTYVAIYRIRYPNCIVQQGEWFLYTMPVTTLCFVVTVLWMQVVYLGLFRKQRHVDNEIELLNFIFLQQNIIEKMYFKLGKITWNEIIVGVLFSLFMFLWIIDTILHFFDIGLCGLCLFIRDAIPFLIITFLVMLLPAQGNFFWAFSSHPSKRPISRGAGFFTWTYLQEKVPWARLLVVGAAITMASAQISSGLTRDIAECFEFLKGFSYFTNLFFVTFFSLWLTEFTTNVITCGMFIPAVMELCVVLNLHPIALSLPFTLTCSLGMLSSISSANIKNISIFTRVRYKEFIKVGFIPKLFSWLVILVTFPYYGLLIFDENRTVPTNFTENLTCYCEPCVLFKVPFHNFNW